MQMAVGQKGPCGRKCELQRGKTVGSDAHPSLPLPSLSG